MAAGLLALLCLGLSLLATNVESQRRCSVPAWNPQLGDNPITLNRGKVLLVALLKGYCSYCVVQAGRLESLKNRLAAEGYGDIAMVIVNGGEPISRSMAHNLISASSLPVLQDTENHEMFRVIFRGNKDAFVVYDRCGQRIAYIPHPHSNLVKNITERVLKTVHNGRHGCHCRLDPAPVNPHDVMYGDQPGQPTHTMNDNSPVIDCPQNDSWCRRYVREYSENRLELGSQQDHRPNRHHSSQRNHRHRSHGNGIRISGAV